MKLKTKINLVYDIELVIDSLKEKRKYLNVLDEDIKYLEDEVLRTVKNISVD